MFFSLSFYLFELSFQIISFFVKSVVVLLKVFFAGLHEHELLDVFHDESGFGETCFGEIDFGEFIFGEDVSKVAFENRFPVGVLEEGLLFQDFVYVLHFLCFNFFKYEIKFIKTRSDIID